MEHPARDEEDRLSAACGHPTKAPQQVREKLGCQKCVLDAERPREGSEEPIDAQPIQVRIVGPFPNLHLREPGIGRCS